jgi:hypothetical protein
VNDHTDTSGSLIPPIYEPSTHDDIVRAMIDADPGPEWDDDSPYIVAALERVRDERDDELREPMWGSLYDGRMERREMEREGGGREP